MSPLVTRNDLNAIFVPEGDHVGDADTEHGQRRPRPLASAGIVGALRRLLLPHEAFSIGVRIYRLGPDRRHTMSGSAAERKTGGSRRRSSSSDGTNSTSASPTEQSAFVCPECGKSFSRAQALGAHRSRTHGVAGTSRAARATSKRTGTKSAAPGRRATASKRPGRRSARSGGMQFDRDKVLAAVFPNGVPPKAERDRGAGAVARRGRAAVTDAVKPARRRRDSPGRLGPRYRG